MYVHQTRLGCFSSQFTPRARCNVIGSQGQCARIRRHALAEEDAPAANPVPFTMTVVDPTDNSAFTRPVSMEPMQQQLSNIPLVALYPALLAAVGACGAVGYMAGNGMPVEPDQKQPVATVAAVLVAAAAATVAVQAKKIRDSAAIVDLYNSIVALEDPMAISDGLVTEVSAKYGINLHKEELQGLQKLYSEYLTSCIPLGDNQLLGDEPAKLLHFRNALGLSEEEAAPVHLEVGGRLYREGFETKDRTLQQLNRRAFQRLIYVSAVMFGDQKASVLLPWGDHFALTNAQVFVARRDNAKAIFKSQLHVRGGGFPANRAFLAELREYQASIKMLDESAEEVVVEESRAHVEAILEKAIACIQGPGKGRDTDGAVAEVKKVIDYSRAMANMAGDEGLLPGLGPVSIHGGNLLNPATGGKTREIHELYKAYISVALSKSGQVTDELETELQELQAVLCISAKEAARLRNETVAVLYRDMLKELVQNKELDKAESPATVLQELCNKVGFSPEAAMELHKELYTNKLRSLMKSRSSVSDGDGTDLSRIARILCLTNEVTQKAQMEIFGKQLENAIAEVYEGGARALPESDLARIEKVIKELRMDSDAAQMVCKKATITKFRAILKESQNCMEKGDRLGSAQNLRNLIQFNTLVVTPVLDRIQGTEAAKKELAELLMKAKEEAAKEEKQKGDKGAKKEGAEEGEEGGKEGAVAEAKAEAKAEDTPLKGVEKALKASRGEFSDEEKKGQKEISLKEDLDEEKRAELYKQYLMLSMQGDFTEMPMGGPTKKKQVPSNQQAEMARLSQLADILGMSQMEVGKTHQGLAKDAFKNQAQDVLRAGPMNEESSKYLTSMQTQLGLTKDVADEVLKEVRLEVYGSSNFTEDGTSWTLEKIVEERKEGKTLEGKVEEVSRRNLFRKELAKMVTDGAGELDADYILNQLPQTLELEKYKVDRVIKEMVGSRRRTLLVQAVSQVRQNRSTDAVISLNNLISCYKVLPDKMPWKEEKEIHSVFQAYCRKVPDEAKRSVLQEILALSDEEANRLRVNSQLEEGDTTSEDEEIFF